MAAPTWRAPTAVARSWSRATPHGVGPTGHAPTRLRKERQLSETGPLLGIYLNDHLAGATAGLELFRRAARSQPAPARAELERLTAEVQQDREALLRIMRAVGAPVRRYKVLGGWLAEKAGRVKPNGHLVSRSPLSDLVELEGLVLGVTGKAAGFRALQTVAERDPRIDVGELEQLVRRAERQRETVEELRRAAARRAFTTTT